MSGIEVAGIVLGAFPLIISALEHYRDCAKVAGCWWQVRSKYQKCISDVRYHEILYKRNLEALLVPIVDESDDVSKLISDPGGSRWDDKLLQQRLESRLREAYQSYLDIITEMVDTAATLKEELRMDRATLQSKLLGTKKLDNAKAPKQLTKANMEYHMYRIKFSLGEATRNELFAQMETCNSRLKKLLSTSDQAVELQSRSPKKKKGCALETALTSTWKKADILFRALQTSWKCSCQSSHLARLRLEHRDMLEARFDVLLEYAENRSSDEPWTSAWFHVEQKARPTCAPHNTTTSTHTNCSKTPPPPTISSECTAPTLIDATCDNDIKIIQSFQKLKVSGARKKKGVQFANPPNNSQRHSPEIQSSIKQLCECLSHSEPEPSSCLGVIAHDEESYHLHTQLEHPKTTTDHVVSLSDRLALLTRRQRYTVALIASSSMAQLYHTPWLLDGMTKNGLLFLQDSDIDSNILLYIRRRFENNPEKVEAPTTNDRAFRVLGILLLELCFGRPLEMHPLRIHYQGENEAIKHALDVTAAVTWSREVLDEAGPDYASAVQWCFTGGVALEGRKTWHAAFVQNVIQPLEACQQHFKVATIG